MSDRINAIPYFGDSITFDAGIVPMGIRAAEKKARALAGICCYTHSGRVVLRRYQVKGDQRKRWQVWGARGTYAIGTLNTKTSKIAA